MNNFKVSTILWPKFFTAAAAVVKLISFLSPAKKYISNIMSGSHLILIYQRKGTVEWKNNPALSLL